MTETESSTVQRTVTVEANPDRAFDVFTAGIDAWWPKTHHIGTAPMKESRIECRVGGRCYSVHEDGAAVDWGKVLVWEPPHRLVLAWQVTHQWGYEPDLAKASEVEVCFTALAGGKTRVDLEHRYFERMGPGGDEMRTAVAGGWGSLLEMFAARAGEEKENRG
jgi:uncharacterized protein YndB with AHSA1/START domain